MRRVLIVDDPRLTPRLLRLRVAIGDRCDVLIGPRDQLDFWRTTDLLAPQAAVGTPADSDSLIATAEGVQVVVAAASPEALKTASKLVFRRGSTVAVLPDATQTADWVFSLFPLSEGAVPRIQGVLEHRGSPAVAAFRGQLPALPGDRHLQCTCTLPTTSLKQGDIERLFVEDIDLLRELAGEFKTLIAVAVPDANGDHRSLTVTLGGESSGTVTWNVQPGSTLTWQIRQGRGDGPPLHRSPDGEYSVVPESDGRLPIDEKAFVPWQDVLRAFDDLAALRRSLKKRRLVELQTEIISEQAQFKSVMSASGCGLLMATLFGAVALLAAGAAFDPRQSQQRTSEKAGLVLRMTDFQQSSTELTEEALVEWPGMVRRLSQTAAPILIEQTGETSIDQQRRNRLVVTLTEAGVLSPASRVEIYEFRGKLFLNLLTALWVLLFLPLGVFLAVQALLLAAPPSKRVDDAATTGG
jgi:hypothetical protein